ncbi:MAG: type II toxin-antitoxin system VapC family toxin [Kiritimatiellae bacterium]|jgi:predicted nucleic acid-binding protein|nr:type II toxin-antitoxin system VapC family toxin [Kiritimatiellia bacterium]
MKRKVYIETTVVSYFTGQPTRDLIIAARQEETRALWPRLLNEYDAFVSALVLTESREGNSELAKNRMEALASFPVLDVTEEAEKLAHDLLSKGAVPEPYPEDALHIAIAAANGMEIILSLNFKHINNPFLFGKIRSVVQDAGYTCPEICSPEQLLENEIE